ncbi:MAG: hypothetical protein E7280_00060 [Lachnospiraceae bacterium]|jgi:hypothetical protein|nr:hypothetical protein [Lachnospiraceae bacterium]
MAEVMAFRVMGGLCLWGSAVCLTVPERNEYGYIAVVILLAGVAMDLSYRLRDYLFLRLPALLLPLLGLIFISNDQFAVRIADRYQRDYIVQLIFMKEHWFAITIVPVMIYLLAIVFISNYDLVYWSYKRNFIAGLIPGIVLMFINFFSLHKGFDTYFLALLYVIIGSFCLRQLRLGALSDNRVKIINGVAMGALALVCAGVSKFLMQFERLDWINVYTGIFVGLGYLMQWMAAIAVYVTDKLRDAYVYADSLFHGKEAKYFDDTERVVDKTTKGVQAPPVNEKVLLVLLIIAAIVVVALLLRYIIPRMERRKLVRRHRRLSKPAFVMVHESGEGEKRQRKEKGNRGKIRATYRQYLLLILKRGAFWNPGDTSKDIGRMAMFYGEQEKSAEELRQIYIKVRYSPEYEPDNEEVRKAKELIRQLKMDKA